MIPALDHLQVIPLENLILHEAHDESRLKTLRDRVTTEKVQRNPVIVTAHNEKFLLLDGAHRALTMSGIGCDFILAQKITPPKTVESWTHLLVEPNLESLDKSENLISDAHPGDDWLTAIEDSDGETTYLRARSPELACEVRALWDLQSVYPKKSPVRRLDSEAEAKIEPGEVRLFYRRFTVEELVEVVRDGSVLPAGITRFRVPERVLNVRFPLKSLADGDLASRNAELREMIERQWNANQVRRYDEPVVLFE